MSSRISSRLDEGSSSSSYRKRQSTNGSKGWNSANGANRSNSQSPLSENEPNGKGDPIWQADPSMMNEEEFEHNDFRRRASNSYPNGKANRDRSSSIPHAPPTLEEDSFYEEDDSLKSENVLSNWHFAPLLIAILPPLGAVIGGQADAWSDAILLLLASFWLYQFLKVPHDIYHAARTRRILHADSDDLDEEVREDGSKVPYEETVKRSRERAAAAAELRRAEMFSLIALVLSPIAGAYLLTWLMEVFTDGNRYLNKFNIRLFMLASGIKPWSHALGLFRQRLLHLQEVVHYPSSRVEMLNRKLVRMESDLSTLRKLVATKSDVSLLREGIDLPLTQLSRSMRRYEKKEEHLRMSAEDKFSLVESRLEDLLREVAINAELIEEERRERQRAASLPASIFQALRYALGQRSQEQSYSYEGQRTLNGRSSLGITASGQFTDPSSPGKIASLNSSTSSSTTEPSFSSPPRYGPTPPSNESSAITKNASSQPGWTEEGLAYWVFLPINIPRSVIRGAMSYAGGRMNNPMRDPNYAQGFANAMTANAVTNPVQNGGAQGNGHARITSSNSNGKQAPRVKTFGDRLDTRPTSASPVTTPSHFTRRV